jgi:hypothetical protein
MGKKLSVESLRVDSFETGAAEKDERGTVRGNGAGCTCVASCLCRTAYYNCGTGPHTIHSCDYTYNDSCGYDTKAGCDTWQFDCL